ncbi:sacsin N-terminal ATP-binding-like domain-containing protein [Bailinhaonella thermotolerans]|uniref:Molecular chaperone Hsp90 n=1 Tax=Bailinhaonella thermotolerans TaxID=1070861 RepID=A0A3A4AUB5_9ACTN|nr:hypothetical protein [Bailinhaonella thermotolerans]RJL33155.1 hypothetical protein D5H75_09905 [Bailinhaonella thermotolerans]
MSDPFGTDGLRERVLAGWAASPARFREDANAEEDFALGGYRDRVIVELAQNAADAALAAGERAVVRFTLSGSVLEAANTGAPLTADGVEALSTLRASAKRETPESAGRFGVGFAAVAAVSDEPSVFSRSTGGVRWSRAETFVLASRIPVLADELGRRGGTVPVLRLPFPLPAAGADPGSGPGAGVEVGVEVGSAAGAAAGSVRPVPGMAVPDGFETLVRLPLRDDAARELVARLLKETGPALLLALPALERVEIEVDGERRALTAAEVSASWRTHSVSGDIPAELLADRPSEERARPYWRVTWAVPAKGETLPGGVPPVVHAPTPSDERLDLPALLIASFPLASDRRHVAPGALTDFLVERAAEAYVETLSGMEPTPRLLAFVPGPMGAGELDAAIRRAVLARLPDAPLLPVAAASSPYGSRERGASVPDLALDLDLGLDTVPSTADLEGRVPGRKAVVVDGTPGLITLLAEFMPGLLPYGWPARHAALGRLGVKRVDLADVVDLLGDLRREPAWWRELYEALAGADPEALGSLPVPLSDGRLVRGPRGTLIMTERVPALDPLGLRIVHPEAAHPLLVRLGAAEATPRAVLDDALTRAAVAASLEEAEPEAIAEAVLSLADAAGLRPGEEPWLGDLALPGADGEWYPANELLLPGGAFAQVVAADAPFGEVAADLVERFGPGPLEAVGVLGDFALVRDSEVVMDADESDHGLDDEDAWIEEVLDRLPDLDVPPVAHEFAAVRDLEYVGDWDRALPLLARPPLREAVLEPLRLPEGTMPSYTGWWLREHPVLNGACPCDLRLPDADPLLAGLYGEARVVEEIADDLEFLEAIGIRTTLGALLAEPGGPNELLDRLADPGLPVTRAQLKGLWTALAAIPADRISPPARIRGVRGGDLTEVVVSPAEDAVVVEAPDLLPLLGDRTLVLAPFDLAETLAELLDLPLAGEVAEGPVTSLGVVTEVPAAVRALLPTAPETWTRHENLLVNGVPVRWRYLEGTVHAADLDGLARGLAWAAGRWQDRLTVAALLHAPESAPLLLAESDLDV